MLFLFAVVLIPHQYAFANNDTDTENVTTSRRSAPSSQYHVLLECASTVIVESDAELSKRLSRIVNDALVAANALHLRQHANFSQPFTTRYCNDEIRVEILRRAGFRDRTVLYFVAYHHDLPIPGDVIGEDLKLLTASHISAILQYPLNRVLAQTEVTRARWSPWLTISLIISSGVLLLCVGWFILFIYFNSCGARPLYQGVSKIVYQKDDTTQCETPVLLHGESRDKPDRIVDETRKHADENPDTWNASDPNVAKAHLTSSTEQSEPFPSEKTQTPFIIGGEEMEVTSLAKSTEPTVTTPLETSQFKQQQLHHRSMNGTRQAFDHKSARPKAATMTRQTKRDKGGTSHNIKVTAGSIFMDEMYLKSPHSSSAISSSHPRPAEPTQSGELQIKEMAPGNTTLEVL